MMRRLLILALVLISSCTSEPGLPDTTTASTSQGTVISSSPATLSLTQPEELPAAERPPPHPFVGRWLDTGPDLGHLIVDSRSLIWDGEEFYQMLRVGFGDVRVWQSVDAIEWVELPRLGTASTIDGPRALMASERGLVAVGNVGTSVLVWQFEGETPWPQTPAGFNGIVDSAIDFDGVYLVAGSVPVPGGQGEENRIPIVRRGAVWASTDLMQWDEVAGLELFGELSDTTGISLGGDGVVVTFTQLDPDFPEERSRRRATSVDGITWRVLDEELRPDHIVLRPDPEADYAWTVQPDNANPFPAPGRVGSGSGFAEWKGVSIVSGLVLDVRADQQGPPQYPAIWSLASGDTWVEVGPFSQQLTEPGHIGRLVIAGDRIAAFGSLRNEGENGRATIFTFVLEFPIEDVIPNWPNMVGLGQVDPEIWTNRMNRACTEGVWDDDVARRLAEDFITEDLPHTLRDDGVRPPTDEAAQALWLMAVNYCRADFPAGEIQDGPIGR